MIAVGADHPATEYAGLLNVPELDFERFLPMYAPAGVHATPSVLLGRSFLEHFVYTYHGPSGTFQFHNAAQEAAQEHDFEE